MDLIDFLLAEMREKKLAPVDITKIGGLSPSQVSKILNRESPAGRKAIVAFAKALGLPPQLLFAKAEQVADPVLDKTSQEILYINDQLSGKRRSELLEYARLQLRLQQGDNDPNHPKTHPHSPPSK